MYLKSVKEIETKMQLNKKIVILVGGLLLFAAVAVSSYVHERDSLSRVSTSPINQPPEQSIGDQSTLSSHRPAISTSHKSSFSKLAPPIQEEVIKLSSGEPGELKEKTAPDGSIVLDLKGRFRHVPVATLNKDGSITIQEFSQPNITKDQVQK
ncbi:MAG: hypothetical protein AMJ53_00645 [Gammaproteobacteria bacterium SG8_11]|nr:MAG: hypothetical protein AMJ53_00645 [Gammaproteobacteria bacterium SG8_11]